MLLSLTLMSIYGMCMYHLDLGFWYVHMLFLCLFMVHTSTKQYHKWYVHILFSLCSLYGLESMNVPDFSAQLLPHFTTPIKYNQKCCSKLEKWHKRVINNFMIFGPEHLCCWIAGNPVLTSTTPAAPASVMIPPMQRFS